MVVVTNQQPQDKTPKIPYWYVLGLISQGSSIAPVPTHTHTNLSAAHGSKMAYSVVPRALTYTIDTNTGVSGTLLILLTSRARSLRNLLVSGNECGRVFPAGVGPGSPSRDAANWLPSRFSLSVETRRRYGWLRMMVFPGARLFPSPNLGPFGRVAARERQGALSRRAW